MSRPLKLSEAVAIALHSAALMGWAAPGRLAARTISQRFRVSEAHLSKVLQRLARAGVVDSTRGPRGGFSLAKPADETFLVEVYEAIEGPIGAGGCLFQQPLCDGGDCILGDVLVRANRELVEYLRNTSLGDLRHLFDREPQGEGPVVALGRGQG